ncbi:unannotated protein [freshwater metagenome]|uniref:Unannotated protein n=1 Tax=freshwater metagenome TaxID=449393 RepID=A0A6J7L022_9ZZZZ
MRETIEGVAEHNDIGNDLGHACADHANEGAESIRLGHSHALDSLESRGRGNDRGDVDEARYAAVFL